jgi:hypothetical protein
VPSAERSTPHQSANSGTASVATAASASSTSSVAPSTAPARASSASEVSLRLVASMSVQVPNQRAMRPASSRSGTARARNHR